MIDEIEKRRLCPVQVVEDEDQRTALSKQLEQHPDRTKRVLARDDRLICDPDGCRDLVQQLGALRIVCQQPAELAVGSDLLVNS